MKKERHLNDGIDFGLFVKIFVGIIIFPFLLVYWMYKIVKLISMK